MADILIRGMEMPKICLECPCCDIPYKLCKAERPIMLVQPSDAPPARCPLVPLPEGHGRLGDLDALLREHGLGKDCENCDRNTRDCNYDICLSRMDVCGWIDDAPTVVPAEGGNADGN